VTAAPAPRILVVDDDAWIRHMVSTVLAKRGFTVVTAQDGEDGLRVALAEKPDLIVTDVMMPQMDGWTLVKTLRTRPEFAFVPVIFLTALRSDEDRIKGFRLGADDYVPKPFRFEELDLRVAAALRRKQPLEAESRKQVRTTRIKDGSAFTGQLDQLGLASVLTLLEMERKSGVLLVTEPKSGDTARLFIREGRLVLARLESERLKALAPRNSEAVYHLLAWVSGKFEFSALEVDMDDEIGMSTTALLMEGARLLDEAANEAAQKRPGGLSSDSFF
jgi:DNA-binding response OmpR family regulator